MFMLSSIMCDNIEKYYANFFSNQNPILFPVGMPMMDTLTGLTPRHICVPVPIHGMDFQRHMSWPYLCPMI